MLGFASNEKVAVVECSAGWDKSVDLADAAGASMNDEAAANVTVDAVGGMIEDLVGESMAVN